MTDRAQAVARLSQQLDESPARIEAALANLEAKGLIEFAPQTPAAGEGVVYLREIDAGTDNACWVVCAKGDPGCVPFSPSPTAGER